MVQPSAESILETPQSMPGARGGPNGAGAAWRPEDHNVEGLRFSSPDDELYRQLRFKVEEGRDRTKEWRDEARESQQMAAGHQWDDQDLAVLRASDRPEITFDRTGRNIDLLSGQEINNRDELAFVPREDGDVVKSEILTGAVQYINDETDSLDEVSDAFRDLCITGMGWTETHMNYRNFQMGLPQQVRRDPITMFWDPYAVRRNLKDAEWVARVVSMPMYNAMRQWPRVNPAMLNAFWMGYQEDPSQPNSPERQTYSYDSAAGGGTPPLLNRATLVEVQWFEPEQVVEMEDLFTGERKTMPRGRAQAIMHNIPGRFRGLPREKNVYYTAVLGGMILSKRRMDVAEDFTFQCMTGKRDSKTGWYGLVRAMKDPQKWANKWLSQSMHVMNRNSKGGVVAEEGAFVDPIKAEAEWGKTGSFTWAEPGAVTQGRYKEKDPPNLPNTLHQLMPVAMDSIQACAGIPEESLGQGTQQGNTSALFEHQRREAGFMIMSPLFDAKRLHTKRQGRVQLRFILNFMNDGRLVKIVEEGQQKFVPLLFREKDALKYDVIVSDAPDSPNQRTKTWSVIERLMPFIAPLAPGPEFWMTIVRASPLPSKVQTDFISHLEKQMEESQEEQQPEALTGRDAAALAKVPAEIQKLAQEAKRLAAQAKELETQAMLNMSKVKTEQANQTLAALEGVRETVAVQDAREAQKLTVHENA